MDPMKKTTIFHLFGLKPLFLLVFLITTLTLTAQNYLPMAVDSSYWLLSDNYNCGNFGVIFDERRVNYYLYGDTTISSVNYKKVYRRTGYKAFCGDTIPPSYSPFQLYGVIRDDTLNKKVYAILFQNLNGTSCPINQEFMLYDFDLQVGDSIKTNDWCLILFSDKINSIMYSPTFSLPNVKNFELGYNLGNNYLYEGIGSSSGLFELNGISVSGPQQSIYQYCRGGCDIALGLGNKTFLSTEIAIYPNPNNGLFKFTIDTPFQEAILTIFDLTGKVINQQRITQNNTQLNLLSHPKGMYFYQLMVDGKQVTGKLIVQ